MTRPRTGARSSRLMATSALLAGVLLLPIRQATATTPADTQDARLGQALRLDLSGVPLTDYCWVLERRTGIEHRVADRPTGDLLASTVGSLTAAQLQQSLADVLGVTWKRTENRGQIRYTAERDRSSLAEEARELVERDREFRKGLLRLYEAANLPDEARSQLPRELQARLDTGFREAVQLLGDLTPEEWERVLSGGGVVRAFSSFSAKAQAQLQTVADEQHRRHLESVAELRAENSPFADRVITRERPYDLRDGKGWQVQIAPKSGVSSMMLKLYNPDVPGFGVGISPPVARPRSQDPARYRLAKSAVPSREAESQMLLPSPFQPEGMSWEEMIHSLERTLHLPVVSDAYTPADVRFHRPGPPGEADTLESYLDRACRFSLNRRWGRAGPALAFQQLDRATRLREQLPESHARRWRQQIITSGRMSLDHLTEMASLPPHSLLNVGSVLGPQVRFLLENQEMLLLWKELPAKYRPALTGEGAVIRNLPLAVQPRARALVSAALGSAAPLVLSNARLRVEQTEKAFTFSILSPGRAPVSRRVDLTCPKAFVDVLRKGEQARVAALDAAAGVRAEPASLDANSP